MTVMFSTISVCVGEGVGGLMKSGDKKWIRSLISSLILRCQTFAVRFGYCIILYYVRIGYCIILLFLCYVRTGSYMILLMLRMYRLLYYIIYITYVQADMLQHFCQVQAAILFMLLTYRLFYLFPTNYGFVFTSQRISKCQISTSRIGFPTLTFHKEIFYATS